MILLNTRVRDIVL